MDVLNQWEPLDCFPCDGRVPIDDNACIRAIRPIALGRQNWMFAGRERSGDRLFSARELWPGTRGPVGIPRDVLVCMATHRAGGITDLVPARWAALRVPLT